MANPWQDITNFFNGIFQGNAIGAGQAAGNQASDPLGLGSALESGFVSFFKDIWKVIAGPLEIIGGALLIIASVVLGLRGEIFRAAESATPAGQVV